ncbi:hypothetical protein KA005_19685 [bacterium]|nr:hypothetical protein [bacterium]
MRLECLDNLNKYYYFRKNRCFSEQTGAFTEQGKILILQYHSGYPHYTFDEEKCCARESRKTQVDET